MAPRKKKPEPKKCSVGVTPVDCESCGGLYAKIIHLIGDCADVLNSDGESVPGDPATLHILHKESDTRICESCIFMRNMQA